MKFIGSKHMKGTSKQGVDYDFTSIAFLDQEPNPDVTGNWVLVGTAGPEVTVSSLVVGKDYKVIPSYSGGRCQIVYTIPID